MKINLRLPNVSVFDVNRVDVREGETFFLSLTDTQGQKLEWFTNNDPVLALVIDGDDAEVSADEIGTTTILIMANGQIHKTIEINVVEEIVPMASTLGLSAGNPEPKGL